MPIFTYHLEVCKKDVLSQKMASSVCQVYGIYDWYTVNIQRMLELGSNFLATNKGLLLYIYIFFWQNNSNYSIFGCTKHHCFIEILGSTFFIL